jgi:hypothetical protein
LQHNVLAFDKLIRILQEAKRFEVLTSIRPASNHSPTTNGLVCVLII